MKISVLGSSCQWCQIDGLREGFLSLGHQHVNDWTDPDVSFVFVGNPPYEQYLTGDKKVIINALDLAIHCPEHQEIVKTLKELAPRAARVTCISKTVQSQIADLCGIQAEVIYYPMKPVRFTGIKKYPQFKAMLCGRVNDPNKRSGAAIMSLVKAGYNEDEIVIVGSENPRWGTYLGVVSDEVLNDLYNSVDYVMMTGKNEGIGLPAIESAICGAIPIVLGDLSTFNEFWVQSPLGLHYQQLTCTNNVATLIRALNNDIKWKTEVKQDLLGYGELFFRPKFDRGAVASRIIDVFHGL